MTSNNLLVVAAGVGVLGISTDLRISTVTAGVNYRFNWDRPIAVTRNLLILLPKAPDESPGLFGIGDSWKSKLPSIPPKKILSGGALPLD